MSSPLSAPSSPLSTVTSDDLAKSLRRILDSAFAAPEVEHAHDLLDLFEAQKRIDRVTAADLADALRGALSIRSEFTGTRDYAREILARFDSQNGGHNG